jgi:hypothetical protein
MSVPGIGPIISSAMVAAPGIRHQGPRLRRLAESCPQTVLDGRPHGRGKIYRSAAIATCACSSFRPPGSCWSGRELGALRAQTLDRGGQRRLHRVLASRLPTSWHASHGPFWPLGRNFEAGRYAPHADVTGLPAEVCERMRRWRIGLPGACVTGDPMAR